MLLLHSTSFLWCYTAGHLQSGRTGSPRFSGVNWKLWIWRLSAKRLFWQLHISISRNLAWLGMGFPLYKRRLFIKHLNLDQTSMSCFHYFSTRLGSLFSFSSRLPPRLEPGHESCRPPQHAWEQCTFWMETKDRIFRIVTWLVLF